METSSLVSKAKTAFHSAAAKAEKVLTDIKSDLKTDHRESEGESQKKNLNQKSEIESEPQKSARECNYEVKHSRWKPPHLGRKQDWQNRLKTIRRGKKEVEEKEKSFKLNIDIPDHDYYLDRIDLQTTPAEVKGIEKESPAADGESDALNMAKIPPASVIRQLAIAVESGKVLKSMNDLLASSRGSSPIRERASLSFSAMKSLVLRDKEEKSIFEFGDDEEIMSLGQNLFNAEGHFSKWENSSGSAASLPRDIHGAPPECIVVGLSEIIGSFKTLRKMALFWGKVVSELRRLWSEGQPIPRVPLDDDPDLNSCLLHQQLQVINCCISRKKRRAIASQSLSSIMTDGGINSEESCISSSPVTSTALYARASSGDLVLRLGADHPFENLTMLETGEAVYCPVTQDGPILTEDFIKEHEEFVLRTGSVGAGCSQLLSDMQAFKAANPGCILEDFVRWHSPPDWKNTDQSDETKDSFDIGEDPTSKRGQLSSRMQKEGNLWRELWGTAKPVPAVKQTPLFDEDLAVEGILDFLEEIAPFDLFQQLFVSLLGTGFVVAEGLLPTNSDLSKLFYECKDYIVATCQGKTWSDNIDDLCQVYATVESIIGNPEDCLKMMNQSEETTAADEPKNRFKKLSLVFKDRPFLRKPTLFAKKPPKSNSTPQFDTPSGSDENEWTMV